jgi:hypothetical protein
MPLKFQSTGGGTVTLDVPSTSSTVTLTIPANTGNLVIADSGGNLTITGNANISGNLIVSTGAIGIGTTSPSFPLTISRSGAVTYLYQYDGFGAQVTGMNGSGLGITGTFSSSPYAIFTNSTERMRFEANGAITGTLTGTAGNLMLISGTAQNSTSGTSIDFTGIPSWAKRITVVLNAVSTNGTGDVVFQVGAGSIQTSGYTGTAWGMAGTASNANANWSTYATTNDGNTAASVRNGTIVLAYLGSNIWSIVISYGYSNTNRIGGGFGTVTLSGTLDRVRITTSNGTDTFDAGSINILYE